MRKFFAAAVGSVVALVGFAGAANASATIDLIWGVFALPLTLGTTTDTGSRIENINSTSYPFILAGIGLPAGASAQLGTITFHNANSPIGTFEIRSDANGPTDGVLESGVSFLESGASFIGDDITATTTFNSAFMVPEPSALTALGSGIAMLALLYRRRQYFAER